MKRFHCKICKKIIRVRKYPVMMETSTDGNKPADRIGVCNWHAESPRWNKPNERQADGRMERVR